MLSIVCFVFCDVILDVTTSLHDIENYKVTGKAKTDAEKQKLRTAVYSYHKKERKNFFFGNSQVLPKMGSEGESIGKLDENFNNPFVNLLRRKNKSTFFIR